MKRKLIVMRHAKSSWSSTALTDHGRPLNDRGKRDAPKVGAALVERGWMPDLVLSSDAQRTRETFAGMSSSFREEVSVVYVPEFYHAGMGAVQDALAEVDDAVECVLVLGHNPGWETMVHLLSGEPVAMKTATAALMTREVGSWAAAVAPNTWDLAEVIYPREL